MPKIKNIIIFVTIGVIFILIYAFFFKKSPEAPSLVSSSATTTLAPFDAVNTDSSVAQDFLTLLLSVKNIKLDDSIFSNEAFRSLSDSSITLIPDGNEGRPNPFAPLGIDIAPEEPQGEGNNSASESESSSSESDLLDLLDLLDLSDLPEIQDLP